MSLPFTGILTAVAALAAVLALVLLAGRILRASGFAQVRSKSQRLALCESMPLDRVRSLRIVRCDGRELLLLVGGGSDVVIGWLPGAGPVL